MRHAERRLGDVLRIERIPVNPASGDSYVQIGIRSFGRGIFHRDPVPAEGLSKLRYFEVHANRIIVSNIMAWEGAVGLSSANDEGCVGSARFLSYRPIGDIDLKYLNYFFQTSAGLGMLSDASSGSVTRNQTLSPKNFESLSVPLPGLEEQRRIVARLDSAMERLDKVTDLQTKASTKRSALVQSSIARARDTDAVSVASVMSLVRRKVAVQTAVEYREIGIRSFGRGIFHKPALSGAELGEKKIFSIEPGDLIFSSVFAWEGAVARASASEYGRVGSHRFMTYIVNENVADPDYLRFYFLSPSGLEVLRRCSPGGAGRNKTLGIRAFNESVISLPQVEEQRRIARSLLATEAISENVSLSARLIRELRASFLEAAFCGDL